MYKNILRSIISSRASSLFSSRTHAVGFKTHCFAYPSCPTQSIRWYYNAILSKRRITSATIRAPNIVPLKLAIRHKATDTHAEQQDSRKEDRMLIGFTCKVCSHRQYKTMSKNAYKHGVVLMQCDDCKNRHLIADNMGWFRDKNINIQDLMKEKGEEVRQLKDMDLLDGIETDQIKTALDDYDDVLAKRGKDEKQDD